MPISTDTDDRSVSFNEESEDRGQENAIQGALSEEKHLENDQDCCGETIHGRTSWCWGIKEIIQIRGQMMSW